MVTSDPDTLEEILRLAAVAGVEIDVAHEAGTAGRRASSAPLVLVGDDASASFARLGLGRRPGVVLVGADTGDTGTWRRGVDIGAEHVVFLPDAQSWLVDRLVAAAEGCQSRAPIVCVVGGRGGAGATALAVALAVTGVRAGRRTLLIDADPLGGGIDLALGGEDVAGLRWPDLASATGRVSPGSLRAALPVVDELVVLSWDRGDTMSVPAPAMASVLSAAQRGSDLVVIDLPRHLDEAARLALTQCDAALLVVPAEVRACAAATRVVTSVARHASDLRVVVRGPAPAGLAAGDVAAALGRPLAGELRAEPGLAACLERGEPPARGGRGPLAGFCRGFLDELAAHVGGHRAA